MQQPLEGGADEGALPGAEATVPGTDGVAEVMHRQASWGLGECE